MSRALSRATLYPVRSARLPRTGRMEIPAKYQELQQIANSAYTAVFAVKDRGKAGTVFAAKIMADRQKDGNEEVENLRALQNCEQVPRIVEVFHQDYQSILVMEYLAGQTPANIQARVPACGVERVSFASAIITCT